MHDPKIVEHIASLVSAIPAENREVALTGLLCTLYQESKKNQPVIETGLRAATIDTARIVKEFGQ